MPLTLRVQHDEFRNRLDLYASMVFVELVVTIVAVMRTMRDHTEYALGLSATGAVLIWLTYRGAIASARLYGIFIVNIAHRFPATK